MAAYEETTRLSSFVFDRQQKGHLQPTRWHAHYKTEGSCPGAVPAQAY